MLLNPRRHVKCRDSVCDRILIWRVAWAWAEIPVEVAWCAGLSLRAIWLYWLDSSSSGECTVGSWSVCFFCFFSFVWIAVLWLHVVIDNQFFQICSRSFSVFVSPIAGSHWQACKHGWSSALQAGGALCIMHWSPEELSGTSRDIGVLNLSMPLKYQCTFHTREVR